MAIRTPLSDEEDGRLVSKVLPSKKRAAPFVGNLRKDQDESNLRQYISKRCLSLGKVTAEIYTYSIQTKGDHADAHVSLNADAAQHLCHRGFWGHPIYAGKWVFNDKPAAGIKNQQQGEGSDNQQEQRQRQRQRHQQQQVASTLRDSERATAVLRSARSHSTGSPHYEELKLALSPDSSL